MKVNNLIPFGRKKQDIAGDDHPMVALKRDIDRVFEAFWSDMQLPFAGFEGVFGRALPSTDVEETDKAIEVSMELPGLEEKDVEVTLTGGELVVRGEKKAETEKKKKGYHLSERTFGSFYRAIPLPSGIDESKVEAKFKKGVLTVTLPKTAEALRNVRKIEVKAA
jgi:HSP20 family protein